jgi:hypothetical protein
VLPFEGFSFLSVGSFEFEGSTKTTPSRGMNVDDLVDDLEEAAIVLRLNVRPLVALKQSVRHRMKKYFCIVILIKNTTT